jgi:hypothetical protein
MAEVAVGGMATWAGISEATAGPAESLAEVVEPMKPGTGGRVGNSEAGVEMGSLPEPVPGMASSQKEVLEVSAAVEAEREEVFQAMEDSAVAQVEAFGVPQTSARLAPSVETVVSIIMPLQGPAEAVPRWAG